MESRRLVPLGVAVAALVVLAGVASRGRPLAGSGSGAGPTAGFFDYVFTTFVIFAVIVVAVVLWGLLATKPTGGKRRGRNHLVSYLLSIAGGAAIAILLLHNAHFIRRFAHLDQRANQPQQTGKGLSTTAPPSSNARSARLRWDELAIFAALVAGAAAVVVAGRSKKRLRPPSWLTGSQQAVSLALDESLDDLRNEPDLRRAIIAAYARMEAALAGAGLARRPSEAPLEYMERALSALDTSAASVHRLTVLFEWAKFSHHEPEPEMRDEAIDALVAVRDDLRQPVEAVAAA
jgi:Domain of unknown function (DUF4129)